ncbi:hypothetical protein Tco_0556746 [Tanacetum coccineum]
MTQFLRVQFLSSEKTQFQEGRCMHVLKKSRSLLVLSGTLQDYGTMPIFKRTFSQDLDLLEQHLTKDILSRTDCTTTLTNLRTKFENAFNSEFEERMRKYTRYNAQSFNDAMICTIDSIRKYMLEIILHQQRILHFSKVHRFKVYIAYDSQMKTRTLLNHTDQGFKHFKDTLLQHLGNVKKSVAERTRHKRQYERRVNKRQMQMQESKIDTGKALDADLVDTESIRTDSTVQDDNSRSGNDTDADDADIRPIYDEEPIAEVQLTAGCNIFAIGQQHTEQPEIINEGRVDQYPETCQVKSPMLDSSPDNQTTEYSKQSLESENILLKKTVAQFQKDFSRMEAHCIALELKYQNQSLKSGQHGQILKQTSNKAKIEKEIDVLETMNIELEHSVATLHKENETLKQHYKDLYDSIKITRSKTTEQTTSLLANNAELKAQIQEKVFAIAALKNDLRKLKGNSVDTKFDKTSVLGKPVLPSLRNQSVVRQPNAFKSERAQMSKQRFASQVDVNKNLSKPVQSTVLMVDSKPKPRSNNETSRSLHVSKSSRITITAVPKADHSKNSTSFLDSKYFFCSTCHKCVFNANHDACITKLLKEVNSCAKIQSPYRQKTITKPVNQRVISETGRQILYRTRWIPTGKLFDSCTSKVDSEPPHGSNVDIPNIHECKQTLDSMAAEKADISETIVKVDSQMMIQKNDVCSQQFRPQTSMSNDV